MDLLAGFIGELLYCVNILFNNYVFINILIMLFSFKFVLDLFNGRIT